MISKIVCLLFGHAPLTNSGLCGRTGYAKLNYAGVDGIERIHLNLTAECPRCRKSYLICKAHLHSDSSMPKGWREAIENISEFGSDVLSDEARALVQENPENALRLAVRLTKKEAVERILKLNSTGERA